MRVLVIVNQHFCMDSMASVEVAWEYFSVGIYTIAARLSESNCILSVYLVHKRNR